MPRRVKSYYPLTFAVRVDAGGTISRMNIGAGKSALPPLPDGVDVERLRRVIALAREEDFGAFGDLTTALLPTEFAQSAGEWHLVARRSGCLCGAELLHFLCGELAPAVRVDLERPDGAEVAPREVLARLRGPVGEVLTAERIILNILQRLSGIATLTRRFVLAVGGTDARIYDTRKTTPGLRDLERYAVRVGGGHNHRNGLFDAVLIKDNHLAGVPTERLAFRVFELLNRQDRLPARPAFVEVEVDSIDQLRELLKVVGIDVILLDNFTPGDLRAAVRLRDDAKLRGRLLLEASGGVTLETVSEIARTGVDRIAVGALTHSAVALDIGLDAVP